MNRAVLAAVAFYLRHCRWERGRWRLLRWAVPASRRLLRGAGPRTVGTRHGFRIRVDLSDWGGQFIYVTGDYEPYTARVMAALLAPGDVAVDVGANIGFFTLLASRRVGDAGEVFAFEPAPRPRQRLVENLRLNAARNVVVGEAAVCEREGEEAFYEGPPDRQGLSSLRVLEDASRVTRVRAGRLDDLLGGVRAVSLVKIDVEGAEYRVLEGMAGRLDRDRPDLIVEITDEFLGAQGHSAGLLRDRLLGLGYAMYAIGHDGLVPVAADPGRLPAQFNALFTARPSLPPCLHVKETWSG
jgi:FkbM family methyltransferase